MLKRLAFVCAALPLVTVPVVAQGVNEEQKACYDDAFALAQSAAEKTPSEERLAILEDMIAKLESLCDAQDYEAAKKAAGDIKSAISES